MTGEVNKGYKQLQIDNIGDDIVKESNVKGFKDLVM